MLYADGVRKNRQKEYDNIDLHSDAENLLTEQKEKGKGQEDFIKYIVAVAAKRHVQSSKFIQVHWERTREFLKSYSAGGLIFPQIDSRMAEDFKMFLLSVPC